MRKLFLIGIALCLCALVSWPALAQDQGSTRGNLGGIVYDSSKAVVPDAQVTITGPTGSQAEPTNDQGAFLFQTLVPGFYLVKVTKPGFKVVEMRNAEVLINKTTSLEVTLEAGEVSQTVEVSSAAVTVDTSSSSVNSDFADTFYENIPVQRGVASLFYLSPGAVDGQKTGSNNPSISGSSGLENAYIADGVSINDPAFGGLGIWSRTYGALGTGINLSFVKEVQVKTGGFEPQYGHASGGLVQIVTKSGGTRMFGEVAGYFKSRGMQATPLNSDDPQFNEAGLFGRVLANANYEGSAELGGYVPLGRLRNRLFFFGNFNPIFANQYVSPAVNSALFNLYPGGELDRRTNSYDYAGKLTFKISDRHTIESSVFGDPSHTNHVPWVTLNANDASVISKWDFGTRNWAVRYDGAVTSSWLVDGAFTWSWNHWTETPAQDIVQIVDQTQAEGLPGQKGTFNGQGFGVLEPYDSNTRSLSFDTSKTFHFLGQHTVSAGYTWQFPIYDDITRYSGGKFTLPSANASGGDPGYLSKSNPTVAGALSDADLFLVPLVKTDFSTLIVPNSTGCTLCPYMAVPGYSAPVQVALNQTRGRFDPGVTHSTGKYNAAYVNDSWEFSKYATLSVGLRWEEQRLTGNVAEKLFNDMWSPRIGFVVDPKGDRKNKIYANFGRYAFVLPLDAALRALSSEDDVLSAYWAPASTTTGCPTGTPAGASCILTNADGSPNYGSLFVPDAAHLLNNATGGIGQGFGTGVSGGEPFQPGIKMEYTDEFVVGAEHQFRGGIIVSARYIDRRLKRVIEDEGGISVEQFNALAANGGSLNYFIGNPNSKSDVFVNPNEITFGLGTTVATDGSALPAACGSTPYIAYNQQDTFGNILGSACFPEVAPGLFGGEFQPDGKPDTYKDPKREYQAVEIEVNKGFSHNWALVANWRIARLRGNYEGAFRNDNNQADPGISSLFDLTEGQLGLIGQQQGIGPLNTDRRHVVNTYVTYVLDHSKLKNMVFGAGVKVQSGVPLTSLAAQQAYGDPGEVPLFGRGDLGRAPVTGTVDAHVEYPWKLNERLTLKFGFDAFNIANSRRETLINQNVDNGFAVPNPDFQKPFTANPNAPNLTGSFFTAPFSARASVRLTF
jgi:Carboxypeptidase regulatory-like domain